MFTEREHCRMRGRTTMMRAAQCPGAEDIGAPSKREFSSSTEVFTSLQVKLLQ